MAVQTMEPQYTVHSFPFLYFYITLFPRINNWSEQLLSEKTKISHIRLFIHDSLANGFGLKVGKDVMWQQSLCHLSQCGFRGNAFCHTFSPEPIRAILPTLSAAQSALCSWLRVGSAPSTHISVKTTQSQTHSFLANPYVNTHSWSHF